jgi:hypothetical protein
MNQEMSKAVHAQMEQLFGSDDAIGMRVSIQGRHDTLSMAEFRAFKEQNPDFEKNGEFAVEMPDGSSSVVCTNYAQHIKTTLKPRNVEIVGFFCSDNQDCTFTRMDLAEGHDFALVDGRYLVDPWLRLVCGYDNIPMVYDLLDQKEAKEAAHMYGARERWAGVGQSN